MKMRTWCLVVQVSLALLAGGGCKCCRKRCCPPPCPPACPPAGVGLPAAPAVAPLPAAPAAPAANLAPLAEPAPPPPGPFPSTPPPAGNDLRGYPPAAPWQPAPGQTPAPQQPAQPPAAHLNVPEPAAPSGVENRSPSLPAGIPQFASAREGVASGLKPLAGGFDWLRANGYRGVLHLRRPAEDDSADRQQVEKLGLRFLSLEVSPVTLSAAMVEQFNRLVTDASLQPLFVYDQDGVLAGGMWYLHFRTAERLSDAQARTLAGRLGLAEDATGDGRAMWLAIHNYLRSTQP